MKIDSYGLEIKNVGILENQNSSDTFKKRVEEIIQNVLQKIFGEGNRLEISWDGQTVKIDKFQTRDSAAQVRDDLKKVLDGNIALFGF